MSDDAHEGASGRAGANTLATLWRAQRRRRAVAAHIILGLVAVALCFVPLFNLLGYEFSAVIAVVATALIAPVTFALLSRGLPASPEAQVDAETCDAPRTLGPGRTYVWVLGCNLALLVVPLAVITANAVRVPVCDYPGGLATYAVIAGVTVAWATLSAVVAFALSPGSRLFRSLVYYGLVLVSLAGTLAYLALEPPIVASNPYLGWFAGSIYDAALAIPTPLIAYRLVQIALIVALVTAMEVAWRVRTGREIPYGLRTVCGLACIAVVVAHSHHAELGYGITRDDIQEELGGRYETEHFIIYHPTEGDWPARIAAVAEDHEYRYWQHRRFFGVEPEGKIVSYIYPNRETKGRLFGAKRTSVAKLWLGEIHIIYKGYGNRLLTHELAHIFTEPFGSGPLSLSAQWGLLPNMGLVEGAAVAATWSGAELTPHGWAAALHRLDLAPDVGAILGAGGFWSRQGRTVYTMMGSFSRWLIETRGIEKFRAAYAFGDIEGAYGETIDTLVAEWRAYLDAIELDEEELALASFYFDRPSIFGKVCARNLASRLDDVEALARMRRYDPALEALEDIIELAPDEPSHRHRRVELLARAGEYETAIAATNELLSRDGLGATRRAALRRELGDIFWRQGDLDGARSTYLELVDEKGLPLAERRALRARVLALDDPTATATVRRYFLDDALQPAERISMLYEALEDSPGSAIMHYLLGIQLHNVHRHASAARHMTRALVSGLEPANVLVTQARLVLGMSHFFMGRLQEADTIFDAVQSRATLSGIRAQAADWRRRILWKHDATSSNDGTTRQTDGVRTGRAPAAPHQWPSAASDGRNVVPAPDGCLAAMSAAGCPGVERLRCLEVAH